MSCKLFMAAATSKSFSVILQIPFLFRNFMWSSKEIDDSEQASQTLKKIKYIKKIFFGITKIDITKLHQHFINTLASRDVLPNVQVWQVVNCSWRYGAASYFEIAGIFQQTDIWFVTGIQHQNLHTFQVLTLACNIFVT